MPPFSERGHGSDDRETRSPGACRICRKQWRPPLLGAVSEDPSVKSRQFSQLQQI